jgi:hypothetical protein
MRELKVCVDTFSYMLKGLIESGVTFEAIEDGNVIVIKFTGGY